MSVCALGKFLVSYDRLVDPVITVSRASDPNRIVWQSNSPFLLVANSTSLRAPISNGNYQLEERVDLNTLTNAQSINSNSFICDSASVSFTGILTGPGTLFGPLDSYNYSFKYYIPDDLEPGILNFQANITSFTDKINRLYLSYAVEPDEGFYGFGESFTYVNLRDRAVPILVSEQGVGRGVQNLTNLMNNASAGSGGYWLVVNIFVFSRFGLLKSCYVLF